MKFLVPFILGCSVATTVVAHPHVFIDTGLELIVDESGQLTHVRVIWEYDDLYSLLITEDMALDPDGDGVLTSEEIAKLTGFDMQWIDGFNGDLVVENKDGAVALSGPQEQTASFDGGRITTTHIRALQQPIPANETATIKPYDPTYYTAYELTRSVDVIGETACKTKIQKPDVNAGLMALQQELAMLDPQMDPSDAGLPEIGAQMASVVVVTCEGS